MQDVVEWREELAVCIPRGVMATAGAALRLAFAPEDRGGFLPPSAAMQGLVLVCVVLQAFVETRAWLVTLAARTSCSL